MARLRPKKFSWKKFWLWTGAIVIVITVTGLFAANYAVNRLLGELASFDQVIDQPITAEVNSPQSSDDEEEPAANSEGGESSSINEEQSDEGDATVAPVDNGQSAEDSAQKPVAEDNGQGVDLSYKPEISPEKAAAVQENITVAEKVKVASLLLSKLDSSDIQLFTELSQGGMNIEEKKAAKRVILEKLTPEEYDELIAIAARLGLSRGKTYDETSKD